MNIDKLDEEVNQILSSEDGSRAYSEIRSRLKELGYNQEELRYIMGRVDDGLLTNLNKVDHKKIATRNMIIGSILAGLALLVIGGTYVGQHAPKEVYYISLVVFSVGYLIFRKGFRLRKGG